MLIRQSHPHRQHGMSLIELMVAIVIGTILMTGLVAMFTNSSRSRRELEKTGVLIENGRYAMQMLYDDISHAGFYGTYYSATTAPGTMPDPCVDNSTTSLQSAMALPIQGYTAANMSSIPDLSSTTCSLLTSTNLEPGSDILVVRRAATALTSNGSRDSNYVYLQANVRSAEILLGTNAATQNLKKYPGTYVAWTGSANGYEDPFPPTSSPPAYASSVSSSDIANDAADIRRYEVHVYYVAKCSKGSDPTTGQCTSADDTPDAVPTLKRLVLYNGSMKIEPLVEGVQVMKLEYGIDTSPSSTNAVTGATGDGMPDSYTATPSGVADWMLVDGVSVSLLVRSSDATQDYTDLKKYVLNSTTVGPFNDKYYRHVFNTSIIAMDAAGRREIPQ